jgi:hypothetical protein
MRRETGPVTREVMIALAKAFRLTRPKIAALRPQWLRDVAVVAGVCKSFNATFDRARFFKDAGAEEEEK